MKSQKSVRCKNTKNVFSATLWARLDTHLVRSICYSSVIRLHWGLGRKKVETLRRKETLKKLNDETLTIQLKFCKILIFVRPFATPIFQVARLTDGNYVSWIVESAQKSRIATACSICSTWGSQSASYMRANMTLNQLCESHSGCYHGYGELLKLARVSKWPCRM